MYSAGAQTLDTELSIAWRSVALLQSKGLISVHKIPEDGGARGEAEGEQGPRGGRKNGKAKVKTTESGTAESYSLTEQVC